MGNSNDAPKPTGVSLQGDRQGQGYEQLFFSAACHGENITVSGDRQSARRHESFCKGIVFSANTVPVGQRVYVKFVETATNWSGALRFGYSSHDPAKISGVQLPRYACPDLTNITGYWAKALSERHVHVGRVLWFYVNQQGDVYHGIDDEDFGVFFSGVNTNQPLWLLMDIYGNTTGIQLITQQEFQSQGHRNPQQLRRAQSTPPTNAPQAAPRGHSSGPSTPRAGPHGVRSPGTSHGAPSLPPRPTSRPLEQLPVLHHRNVRFTGLPFHTGCRGKNIHLNADRCLATRTSNDYCNAYVFTSKHIHCGERVVIKVMNVDTAYAGGLAFGITSCDPATLNPADLPDDSDLLLDRQEYWAVHKNVVSHPDLGDELSFFLSSEGAVQFSRNGNYISVLMYVDKTLPLHFFFDVYGCVTAIKSLGLVGSTSFSGAGSVSSPSLVQLDSSSHTPAGSQPSATSVSSGLQVRLPRPSRPLSTVEVELPPLPPRPDNDRNSGVNETKPSNSVSSPKARSPPPAETAECIVCFENAVNAVLYKCGHMCLCFDCALEMKRRGKDCPMCRAPIVDVIKPFKS